MTAPGWMLIVVTTLLVLALAKPVGVWLFALYKGQSTPLHRVLGPVERGCYRLAGVDPAAEMTWRQYGAAVLVFSVAGFALLMAQLMLQGALPLDPQGFAGLSWHLALNTAISFVTNTNWQSYSGETTMSHLSQMAGLTVQNFLSAATGIAVAFALIRGFDRAEVKGVGNFWADLTRITLYLLLPLSVVLALVYVALGMPQTLAASVTATTLEGTRQVIAVGPVASQVAIKMLGTNGGGFFNANAAHPFENPSALSNLIQMVTIFAIGAGLTWTFGKAVRDTRQGWAILAAMTLLYLGGATIAYWAEARGVPMATALGVDGLAGNMEGKEVRFGIAASALFAAITTDASCGAVIAMHDSFSALGGAVPLFNIHLGEIIFGGVGSGLYGFLLYCLLSMFVAGLMVGRTPEYAGKKIESAEMKLVVVAVAILPLFMLGLAALAAVLPDGLAGRANQGAHGFTEILYAFTSATGNNGSAFAGLSANTPFYNVLLAIAMVFGRFGVVIPALAIAGSLAAKRTTPMTAGSFPTTGPLWIGLLVAVIMIVGGLTFLPALAFGPFADAVSEAAGQTF